MSKSNLQKLFWLCNNTNDRGCMLTKLMIMKRCAGVWFHLPSCRGPEPWNAAYVRAITSSAVGRENPNRLYQHHQFQVVMKPSPSNSQRLYLESLENWGSNQLNDTHVSLKITGKTHQLVSAGLGWEVWLDGMKSLSSLPTSWWIGNSR